MPSMGEADPRHHMRTERRLVEHTAHLREDISKVSQPAQGDVRDGRRGLTGLGKAFKDDEEKDEALARLTQIEARPFHAHLPSSLHCTSQTRDPRSCRHYARAAPPGNSARVKPRTGASAEMSPAQPSGSRDRRELPTALARTVSGRCRKELN